MFLVKVTEKNISLMAQDIVLRAMLMEQAKEMKVDAFARKSYKKQFKKTGHRLPVNYYTIDKPRKVVRTRVRKRLSEWRSKGLSYRHDRCAHFRLHVRRGMGEMDFKDYEKLHKYGYEIYQHGVPEHVRRLLENRGRTAPVEGEWVAIKKSHIKATVVGDESLPYVPGVRHV